MFYVCIKQQLQFPDKVPIGIGDVVKLKQSNMPSVVNNDLTAGVSGELGKNMTSIHQSDDKYLYPDAAILSG